MYYIYYILHDMIINSSNILVFKPIKGRRKTKESSKKTIEHGSEENGCCAGFNDKWDPL